MKDDKTSRNGLHQEDKDEVDQESRVLREKIAAMLSDEFVDVQPRQQSILRHLRLLVDTVRSHNMVTRHIISYWIFCLVSK